MDLILIAAASENNVIGFKNKIPWKIKEDLQRFRDLTKNHPVIMGRKTYESIPLKFRPLSQRKNIVLSSTLEKKGENIYLARNIYEAIELTENKDSYVIGGEKIYREFLPLISKIELTRIHKNYKGDTFLPEINWEESWILTREKRKTRKKDNLDYSFLTYTKKLFDQQT